MRIASFGRPVFVLQWVLAVLLPIWVFLGRGFVGAEMGWMGVLGFLYGPIVILLLLLPPVLALFDPIARRGRTVRVIYGIAMIVQWVALLLVSITIPDAGDGGPLRPALAVWTGMSPEAVVPFFTAGMLIASAAWFATLAVAVAGILRGRREAREE
ncbi:hypothetical protein [Microbacterium telephonicum]|uniref:Uncharacterized protein n=1 Tax=Microbacterium telephonicum TaxID=1714841 RepID=A0A498C2C9_9MICO|nr:hypothetical protein [Microbacterium telephonicum]RLK46611.1 hypothetical protein C7474_2795 [Microbacterium telephonicum]